MRLYSVDLAHYGVSRGKDWVSVDCGTNMYVVGTNQHAVDQLNSWLQLVYSISWSHFFVQPFLFNPGKVEWQSERGPLQEGFNALLCLC